MSRRDRDGRDRGATDEDLAHALGSLLRSATADREEARRETPELRRRDAAARQRMVEALGAPGPMGVRTRGRATLGLSLAAAAALAAVVAFWFLRSPELDYAVTGAAEVAGYVRADAGKATVAFEDGTAIELARGASGRVTDVRSNGARFVLEDGAIDGRFEKLPGAAWSVHAGPWEIRVTGTEFGVTWDPRRTALRVVMREGSVVVRGPGAEDGIRLRAGQSLEVGDGGAIRVASASGEGEGEPRAIAERDGSAASTGGQDDRGQGDPGQDAAPAEGSPPVAAAPGAPPGGASARPWAARVAAGDYDGILADADARGIDAVIASASASDLSALADAARYRGRSGLATRALKALRDRFPGTAAAGNAAFLLGRMADDAGSAAAAIRWYDAHLAEGGAFAAEAMGRKMLAVRRSRGEAAAAAVARAYLERFPRGAHAPLARSMVEAPASPPPGAAVGSPEPGVMPAMP